MSPLDDYSCKPAGEASPTWELPTKRRPESLLLRSAKVLFLVCVGGAVVLAVTWPWDRYVVEESKRDIARGMIKNVLAPAVERYRSDKENNPRGELPGNLAEVVASPRVGLKSDDLYDPWGRRYHYSPRSTHGKEFDIWSDGSGDRAIGNWNN
jgi:hypothetical protein